MRTGFAVWLTGLPCSGKSTIAEGLARALLARGLLIEVLDGDTARASLSGALGYSARDRELHVHRLGFVAELLCRNGVPTIVAAVSPYRAARDAIRERIPHFVEVFVDCPLSECERRDVKGMYAKARAGRLSGFTGVDDPYEAPLNPDVVVSTNQVNEAQAVDAVLQTLEARRYVEQNQPLQDILHAPSLRARLVELGYEPKSGS